MVGTVTEWHVFTRDGMWPPGDPMQPHRPRWRVRAEGSEEQLERGQLGTFSPELYLKYDMLKDHCAATSHPANRWK